jgi:hypothetical protein
MVKDALVAIAVALAVVGGFEVVAGVWELLGSSSTRLETKAPTTSAAGAEFQNGKLRQRPKPSSANRAN